MKARVLILNAGSSSLKFHLLNMPEEVSLCKGMAERLGTENPLLKVKTSQAEWEEALRASDHQSALKRIAEILNELHVPEGQEGPGISAIGHRVVHGGARFSSTTEITDTVKEQIRELSTLAPLHNPRNLEGIVLSETFFPQAFQVAVFDTAFHRSIPEKARYYAIPRGLSESGGIQVYGFHGTSHKYVFEQLAPGLDKDAKVISLHLGNGCSATAIRGGKSVDHSLGFTPSNGLIMGTRSGDIDHGIVFYMMETLGYSREEVNDILNRKSGLLGLTGYTDLRDIQKGAASGNPECGLAMEMVAYRIRKYIGAYTAAMNGLDALIFTAGIGEHSSDLRKMVCSELDAFGIELDDDLNSLSTKGNRAIHAEGSRVEIWVIPTDEELEIARQTYSLYADTPGVRRT
ncbi:acetate/propionate family kinase [Robiginitalea aurantiaca]|uniref:Acetate kinase n=1 Tax=Robiginitalea aurantiaca TaxID=3056915 RepID=A0ABT7WH86_9FLAO|nr:acetate kinase [Robiginitalea aurantiaca]MDM9632276.1 acetate kinase [Robiginitalea aurantiaca]